MRFDQLALLGKPIDLEDQVEFVLEGLPEEYKSIADQIEGRDSTPSITEVHEKLLNQEAKLLTSSPLPVTAPASAHVATNHPKTFQGRHQQRLHQRPSSNWNQNQYNNRPHEQRTSHGYQGKCQLCGIHGHSVRRCPQLTSQQTTQPAPVRHNQMTTAYPPWQPRANVALASPHPTNAWLMDTGATHHMTSDLNNLAVHQPYNGDDAVLIGDGSGLSITHTGSLTIPSQSKPTLLDYTLCVPTIHKNLVSVYRLCNSNEVSVEFFPSHFQVKDLSSGVPLLQGKTRDELYEWPLSPSAITSLFASSSLKTLSMIGTIA